MAKVSRTNPPLSFIYCTGRIHRCGRKSTAFNSEGFAAADSWAPRPGNLPHARKITRAVREPTRAVAQ